MERAVRSYLSVLGGGGLWGFPFLVQRQPVFRRQRHTLSLLAARYRCHRRPEGARFLRWVLRHRATCLKADGKDIKVLNLILGGDLAGKSSRSLKNSENRRIGAHTRPNEVSSRLLDELASLREKAQNNQALSLQHEQLLQAHQVARERERNFAERLRLVLENSSDYAIFSTDLDRRVTSRNVGAKIILGYTEAEIVGKKLLTSSFCAPPENREAGIPEVEAQTALAEGRALDERRHMRKDGSQFWGSGVLPVIHDTADRPIGFIKIL